MYDPMRSKFANRPLDPWQVSKKKFDFDSGFVVWIQKYLEKLKCTSDLYSAKAWINKGKFGDGERYELCELQWEAYQESLKAPERPSPKPVVSDSRVSGGDFHSADQSDSDGVDDAVERPDEFAKREGESGAEYVARMSALTKANMAKMQENMNFGSKK